MISRLGLRSTFHRPSSRFSLPAARSKRAACACQGLVSCSSSKVVVIKSPMSQLMIAIDAQVSGQASQSILPGKEVKQAEGTHGARTVTDGAWPPAPPLLTYDLLTVSAIPDYNGSHKWFWEGARQWFWEGHGFTA